MLYAPGLNKRTDSKKLMNVVARLQPKTNTAPVNEPNNLREINMVDKISDFVENVRLEVSTRENSSNQAKQQMNSQGQGHGHNLAEAVGVNRPETGEVDPEREARKLADNIILDAEHFWASVATPKGNVNNINVLPIQNDDNDDEFFHLTCHIEPGLRQKIERGEFIELEKLLPKRPFSTQIL